MFFVYIFSFNGFYCCVNKKLSFGHKISQLPSIVTQKLKNLRVTIPRHFSNLSVILCRHSQKFFISKHFPGIVIWKLRNFWVMIPGNLAIFEYHHPEIALKKQLFWIAPRNHGQFWKKIGGFLSRGKRLLIHEKYSTSKISCYSTIKTTLHIQIMDLKSIVSSRSYLTSWYYRVQMIK